MKKVSNEFINLSRKIKTQDLKLTINDGELTVQEVHLMSLEMFNAIPISSLKARKQVIAKELKYSFTGELFKTIMQQIEITVKNASEIKDKYVDFQYGIQINNKFEYVNMGEYYIKDIEDDKNKEELVVTGYDKMINFMKKFNQSELQLTYPCKMSQLVKRMGEVCGAELYSTDFFNSDLIVDEDFFTIQELTYRDVLEKVAQATLTTIFIKEGKLYLCKISDSVQTLDTSFLSNLIIEEKFGPVNALVLGRGSVEDNIESTNESSVKTNGRCEIRFDENEFLDSKREEVIDLMLKEIEGLEYYSIESSNLGLLWLEPCDVIISKDREGNEYKSIYLKASVTINTGIKGEMESIIPETATTEYKVTTKEEKANLKTWRLAKKNEGIIEDVVEQTTENGEKISKVEQTIEGITQSVSEVEKKAVTTVDVFYALGNTTTTAPTTGWATTAPQWQQGKYMWQKTKTTYADGTINESTPTCIAGAKGDKGDKGEQGIQGLQGEKGEQGIAGKDGTAGKTSYFHIKYSAVANPTTESQISEIPNTYIGTYVDFTETDSTDPSKYTWSRFKGLQGQKGEQGIPGTNGIDGTSYYLHIKYSNDGKTFTSNNGETVGSYIGVKTDTNVNDSMTFSDYKWSKTKGETGVGVKKLVEQYYLSTSISAVQDGSWKTAQIKWEEGKYIWTRTQITWTDDSVTYTDPILATNTNDAFSEINQTKNAITEKVGKGEFGTLVEQNWEHVKYAWNQISEFIQMEILNGNASLAFRSDVDNLLMSLDKLGQHFYSGNKNIMDVKVSEITPEEGITKKALMFLLDTIEMENSGVLGWGYKATENGKEIIIPALYLGEVNSGEGYGVHLAPTIPLFLGVNKIYDDIDSLILELNKDLFIGDTRDNTELMSIYKNVSGGHTVDFYSNSIKAGNIPIFDTNISYITGGSSYISLRYKDGSSVYVYTDSSDKNLKNNIKNTDVKAIEIIKEIKHKQFNWKDNNRHQKIGYIAQDMQKIDDNFVHHIIYETDQGKKEDWQINALPILATVTKAIQEQQEQIENQNNLIQSLIERIEKQEGGAK